MKTFKYIVYREGKYFVSQCLNVEVASFGKTVEEATKNLKEALDLYFEDIPSRKNYLKINESLMGELTIKF
ncbi:MAG: type II toxin-antitoxin system HicB family antitoxin [Bacteroidota bacterium]